METRLYHNNIRGESNNAGCEGCWVLAYLKAVDANFAQCTLLPKSDLFEQSQAVVVAYKTAKSNEQLEPSKRALEQGLEGKTNGTIVYSQESRATPDTNRSVRIPVAEYSDVCQVAQDDVKHSGHRRRGASNTKMQDILGRI